MLVNKKTASKAKTAVSKLLADQDASVGLSKNAAGDWTVAVRFNTQPAKKLVTALNKAAGEVEVDVQVVGEIKALPAVKAKKAAKKKKASTTTQQTAMVITPELINAISILHTALQNLVVIPS